MAEPNKSKHSPQPRYIVPSQLDDFGLRPVEFRIYSHLVRRAGRNGHAYPSIRGIARVCGIDKATVAPWLHCLAVQMFIKILPGTQARNGFSFIVNPPSEWVKISDSHKSDILSSHRPKKSHSERANGSDTSESIEGGPVGKTRDVHPEQVPFGYSREFVPVIELWNALVVQRENLRFLPITKYAEATANALTQCLDVNHARRVFDWAMERERSHPTRGSKSLCRLLNDYGDQTGFFRDYPYQSEPRE